MTTAVIALLSIGLAGAAIHNLRVRREVRQLADHINRIDAYAPLNGPVPAAPTVSLESLAGALRGLLTRFEAERSFEREQLAAACHEIRSPLTALKAISELQLDRSQKDLPAVGPESGRFDSRLKDPDPFAQAGDAFRPSPELELTLRNVKRVEDLVNDVLALSLTAHAEHPCAAWGPVEIVSLVRAEACDRSMAMPVNASITTAAVVGDPRRLRWAISNLMANATEHCSSRVEVGIQSDQMSDGRAAVAIRVVDDGAGLGGEDPQRLLLRFRRGSGGPSKSAASGLGLTIVQSVIDDHDGEVWIEPESTLGGAAFTMLLPTLPDHRNGDLGNGDLSNSESNYANPDDTVVAEPVVADPRQVATYS